VTLLTAVLLAKHAFFGAVCGGALLTALLSPKGGRWHRRAGTVAVFCLVLVAGSGLLLSLLRLVTGDDAVRARAMGLALLALASLGSAFAGLRVLRRDLPEARRRALHGLGMSGAGLAAALAFVWVNVLG
jgi:uncharacterized membrane protein